MRTGLRLAVILAALICLAAVVQAEENESCGSPKFVEMSDFHEVLYKIWHEQYPEDDWQGVRATAPELAARMKLLAEAEIPEVFKYRSADIIKARDTLGKVVADIDQAAKADDDQKLKTAVKELHDAYHGLVVELHSRPGEVDQLHTVIALMWHEDYPDKNFASLKTRMDSFNGSLNALLSLKLGKRYSVDPVKYDEAQSALKEQGAALQAAVAAGDQDAAWSALDKFHEAFRSLNLLFE